MNQAAEEYQRVLASISSIDSSTANRSYEAVGSRHYANFYEAARLATGLFIYPIICIVGLAGNCIALIVLSRPTMMTSYNVILSALAANDIIKLLNDLVYFIDVVLQLVDPRAENVLFGHAYPVSHYICNQTACVTAWITVSVAVERYICVCRATRYRSVCTVQRAAAVVAIVFVSMSLLAAPSAFRYRTLQRVIAVPISPSSASPTVFTNRTFYEIRPTALGSDHVFVVVYYHWTLSLIRSVVPLILLTVLNIRVMYAVWSRPSSGAASRAAAASATGRRSAQNRSITAMLALVVVVFAVCIVPDAVMSVVFGVGYVDEQNQVAKGVRELTDALLALSSAVNFIVYCLCSRRFRSVLVDTLYGGRRRAAAAFDDLVVVDADDGAMAADDRDAVDNGNNPCNRRHFSLRNP